MQPLLSVVASQCRFFAPSSPMDVDNVSLEQFLAGCNATWSLRDRTLVVRKLGRIGVQDVSELVRLARSGTLNDMLAAAGERRFNAETLASIRMAGSLEPCGEEDILDEFAQLLSDFVTRRWWAALTSGAAIDGPRRSNGAKLATVLPAWPCWTHSQGPAPRASTLQSPLFRALVLGGAYPNSREEIGAAWSSALRLGADVGRWFPRAAEFVRLLARSGARATATDTWEAIAFAFAVRWSVLFAFGAARSFAASLLPPTSTEKLPF
ncbi:unnamed protein product [Symbiodinium sp. KB8]|nr:unnamed protein product [Symbiodinium sp. KB8]